MYLLYTLHIRTGILLTQTWQSARKSSSALIPVNGHANPSASKSPDRRDPCGNQCYSQALSYFPMASSLLQNLK